MDTKKDAQVWSVMMPRTGKEMEDSPADQTFCYALLICGDKKPRTLMHST